MIRHTTPADDDAILRLGFAMHSESRYAGMSIDADKLRALFAHAREHGFLRVWDDGEIRGGFLGMIAESWFGRDLIAFDLALFVEPGRRGGVIAARLTQAYVAWAQAAGVIEASIGTTTGVNTEAAERLYRAVGFEQVGGLYRRRF